MLSEKLCSDCGCNHAKDKLSWPVGCKVEAIVPIPFYHGRLPAGIRGEVVGHTDDGRPVVKFERDRDTHTFHQPEEMIKWVGGTAHAANAAEAKQETDTNICPRCFEYFGGGLVGVGPSGEAVCRECELKVNAAEVAQDKCPKCGSSDIYPASAFCQVEFVGDQEGEHALAFEVEDLELFAHYCGACGELLDIGITEPATAAKITEKNTAEVALIEGPMTPRRFAEIWYAGGPAGNAEEDELRISGLAYQIEKYFVHDIPPQSEIESLRLSEQKHLQKLARIRHLIDQYNATGKPKQLNSAMALILSEE